MEKCGPDGETFEAVVKPIKFGRPQISSQTGCCLKTLETLLGKTTVWEGQPLISRREKSLGRNKWDGPSVLTSPRWIVVAEASQIISSNDHFHLPQSEPPETEVGDLLLGAWEGKIRPSLKACEQPHWVEPVFHCRGRHLPLPTDPAKFQPERQGAGGLFLKLSQFG